MKVIESLEKRLIAAESLADFYTGNVCPICHTNLGLMHVDACPLCAARQEIERLEALAAARLVDQEAIEKHTRRVVVDEILAMVAELRKDSRNDIVYHIRAKFGVGKNG